jgi:hypothetical protein
MSRPAAGDSLGMALGFVAVAVFASRRTRVAAPRTAAAQA